MKFLGQGFQKLQHEQDRQTHRHSFSAPVSLTLTPWPWYTNLA